MSTNYEQFIAANSTLMDCYSGVSAEQFSAMNKMDQQDVCKNEAAAVRSFLTAGKVDFKNILAERIAAFDAPKAEAATEE
jgi:hypothetical protein